MNITMEFPRERGTWLAAMTRWLALRATAAAAPADRAREAEEVRAMAFALRDTDPRFADDLFAAADRHERAQQAS